MNVSCVASHNNSSRVLNVVMIYQMRSFIAPSVPVSLGGGVVVGCDDGGGVVGCDGGMIGCGGESGAVVECDCDERGDEMLWFDVDGK